MGSILQSGRGGGLIRETKVPMQELELKMEGGLMREGGGVIAGFYGIKFFNTSTVDAISRGLTLLTVDRNTTGKVNFHKYNSIVLKTNYTMTVIHVHV